MARIARKSKPASASTLLTGRMKQAAPASIDEFLAQQQGQDLLRFITCGSVDDGKSTLIGRLLWEAQQLFDDQVATLRADSKKYGTQGDDIDFALLMDGLAAEREQGITIDLAYRFFATSRRKFIVADTPGHEQYTRNMVTGASTTDMALLLVDARQGILTQTRRHAYLASLMGIRHVALAVNKMDLWASMPPLSNASARPLCGLPARSVLRASPPFRFQPSRATTLPSARHVRLGMPGRR
jgi:bifunctional enzyme CysN/CysC